MGGFLNINFGKLVSYMQQKVAAPLNQPQTRIKRNRTKNSNTVTYAKSEQRTATESSKTRLIYQGRQRLPAPARARERERQKEREREEGGLIRVSGAPSTDPDRSHSRPQNRTVQRDLYTLDLGFLEPKARSRPFILSVFFWTVHKVLRLLYYLKINYLLLMTATKTLNYIFLIYYIYIYIYIYNLLPLNGLSIMLSSLHPSNIFWHF